MWETQTTALSYWVCFKTQILLAILKTRNQPQRGVLCIFGSRTFVPISWMCKKQISVSHSSTESEIISVDAGLRMDGLLAFDLWDMWSLRCYVQPTTLSNPTMVASGKFVQDRIPKPRHQLTKRKQKRLIS